jgi:hypothetical protein
VAGVAGVGIDPGLRCRLSDRALIAPAVLQHALLVDPRRWDAVLRCAILACTFIARHVQCEVAALFGRAVVDVLIGLRVSGSGQEHESGHHDAFHLNLHIATMVALMGRGPWWPGFTASGLQIGKA